ncbi:hypothetical protein Q3O93_02805 [Ralstonia pseudosolanacearum]|nr:hypothetical protein [Ralstonia pseudosolanacearum]MDO3530845.1 hypothetical protein [Ralstonia pseudosolanacearum]
MTVRTEDFYDAAARAGLLVNVTVGGVTAAVEFRSPDETVFDGLALAADYSIRFPASVLPDLASGQVVTLGTNQYQVRGVRAIGDGSERRADLSRI